MRNDYADYRFQVFCDEIDTLEFKILQVINDDALMEVENAILDDYVFADGSACVLGVESHRIRNDKTKAIWQLLREFNPDLIPELPPPPPVKKPAKNRIIPRDVACRYLRRFDGRTEWIQTGPDTGYPILIDGDGDTRGSIDAFSKFKGLEAKALDAEMKALQPIPY